MGSFNWASPPVSSTQAASSNPSTTSLIAELLPDNLAPVFGGATSVLENRAPNRLVEIVWTVSASTIATWWLEHANSSALSTGVLDRLVVITASNVAGQFLSRYLAAPGNRFRARIASTFTGDVAVKIQAEGLS